MSESFNDRVARLAKEKQDKISNEIEDKINKANDGPTLSDEEDELLAEIDKLVKSTEENGDLPITTQMICNRLKVSKNRAEDLFKKYSLGNEGRKKLKESSRELEFKNDGTIPSPDIDYKDTNEPLPDRILSYARKNNMNNFPADLAVTVFKVSMDEVLDAFYELAKTGWSGDPDDTVYPINEKREDSSILGDNDNHPLEQEVVDKSNNSTDATSMYDVINDAEKREMSGMSKIATGMISGKDAMMAHEVMDTENQIKAFQVQVVRKELLRIIKLSDALARIEDKYIDTALKYINHMDMETLETTMGVIRESLKRSTEVLDKYTKDEELKMFIQESAEEAQVAYANAELEDEGMISSTTGLVKSRDSRERIRNIASRLLKAIDNPDSIKKAEKSDGD